MRRNAAGPDISRSQGQASAKVSIEMIVIEICGDGRNLGQFECDDGNNRDGDGCSRDCNEEPGFKCITNTNGLDVCRDIIPPMAALKVNKGNKLIVQFTEPVSFTVLGKNHH